MDSFKLADSDLASSTWHKIARHLQGRLETLRLQNDNPQLDAAGTSALRGRIAEVKLLLAAAQPDPPPLDDI